MARADHRKGGLPYQFIAIPKAILASQEWQQLPAHARVLAIDLMAQYTGKNNGRLCPAWEVMRRCGWKSTHTLIAAKRALLECSFATLTRQGHPPRTPDWIAFTWWKLDFERSMDVEARKFEYLNFLKLPTANSVLQKLHQSAPKSIPGPAETASLSR